MAKVAIIAALEREVAGAIKHWRASKRDYAGRRYRFFENERAVLVCGGIGAEAARRACEAVIQLYRPALIISAGLAGGLDASARVGNLLLPGRIIDAADGSVLNLAQGNGTLVSWNSVAGVEQKAKLAKAYEASAVDMEAAAVARGAQARGIGFMAVKAISDGYDFEFPQLERFIAADGHFRSAALVMFAALRPWLWPRLLRLSRNSEQAASTLCAWLEWYNQPAPNVGIGEAELHPLGSGRH
jgi:adenosylhomocysteine nucleosidase